MRCKNCGNELNADDIFCAKCMDFVEDDLRREMPEKKVISPKTVICNNCGEKVSPDEYFCHKCGSVIKEVGEERTVRLEPSHMTDSCPNCGKKTQSTKAKFCRYCGQKFE
ncbi:MAG: zinc ribbon domain-containing protein [Lachnospiraceae bacterium]|nr:zinc ribbon domain-containing protein [Lachnospiraceae bacterium]